MRIKGTTVLEKNLKATSRIVVDQGGARSSKTYSIAQMFIIKLMQETGAILTITRKTMPALKTTAMRDFFEILVELGLYNIRNHNKTENTYILNGNLIEFIGLDNPQKKRGAKRKYLWMNEANEFTFEDFQQLIMRTTGQAFLDYNPSDEFHWIYEKVIPRKDCTFIKSTYRDNPFLDKSLVCEIESLQETDLDYWRIYGLGERGSSKQTIYTNWEIVSEFPSEFDISVYGVDFGFNNPSSCISVSTYDGDIYVDEKIYERRLTNTEFIERIKTIDGINLDSFFYCDSAEPDRIEEFNQNGITAIAVTKSKNSVKDGIDKVKRHKIYVKDTSINLIKEIKFYKWRQDKDGHTLDEPVKFMDHAMDGMRYAIMELETEGVTIWDL